MSNQDAQRDDNMLGRSNTPAIPKAVLEALLTSIRLYHEDTGELPTQDDYYEMVHEAKANTPVRKP